MMLLKQPLSMTVMVLITLLSFISVASHGESVTIDFSLPMIKVADYERPFVAVWVEQPGQRTAVKSIALWYNDKKWLKDIRRWWRKSGRYYQTDDQIRSGNPNPASNIDAISGATRPSGNYQIVWDGADQHGKPLRGAVTLYLEAVREHGGRTLLKQTVHLGNGNQHYTLQAGSELGPVTIVVGEYHAIPE